MTTSEDAKCLLKPTKGTTLLFQANAEHSSVNFEKHFCFIFSTTKVCFKFGTCSTYFCLENIS